MLFNFFFKKNYILTNSSQKLHSNRRMPNHKPPIIRRDYKPSIIIPQIQIPAFVSANPKTLLVSSFDSPHPSFFASLRSSNPMLSLSNRRLYGRRSPLLSMFHTKSEILRYSSISVSDLFVVLEDFISYFSF